jgi:hypothetical protein
LNIFVYYPGREEEHNNKDNGHEKNCHTDIIPKEEAKEIV